MFGSNLAEIRFDAMEFLSFHKSERVDKNTNLPFKLTPVTKFNAYFPQRQFIIFYFLFFIPFVKTKIIIIVLVPMFVSSTKSDTLLNNRVSRFDPVRRQDISKTLLDFNEKLREREDRSV